MHSTSTSICTFCQSGQRTSWSLVDDVSMRADFSQRLSQGGLLGLPFIIAQCHPEASQTSDLLALQVLIASSGLRRCCQNPPRRIFGRHSTTQLSGLLGVRKSLGFGVAATFNSSCLFEIGDWPAQRTIREVRYKEDKCHAWHKAAM